MRILYGVTGEGLGHAMRAMVIVARLEASGHRVKLLASGRAERLLARRFEDVVAIDGLSLRYVRGGVARTRSLAQLARVGPAALRDNLRCYLRGVAHFEPDVCVSDFESFAHLVGVAHGVPVIALDHQHVIDRCDHAAHIARTVGSELAIARALVRAKMPGCVHYVVSSFYLPPVRARCVERTSLVGPILREGVLEREPRDGDHVLVYQTASSDPRLARAIAEVPSARFVVYGATGVGRRANVEHRAFDEARFLSDLASARAVITHGGHTAISEAVHLGKPVLSFPLRGQGEQKLNAVYLERLGLGRRGLRPSPRSIADFLAWSERRARASAPPPGNDAAFAALDRCLAEAA